MGIYIKGMEMPKSCDECRIMTFEDTNCEAELYCGCPIVFKAHPQGVDHRPDYCPLVSVPPHGRLIDADAIRADIDEKRPGRSYEDAWALTIMDAAPTVIEAEEGEA